MTAPAPEHASELPWLVPGAQVAVLSDQHGHTLLLAKVVTVQRVGKLHVVTADGGKYHAKSHRMLRDITHRDAWSSAPYLAELRGDAVHVALHQRMVRSRATDLQTAVDAVRRSLNVSTLAKDRAGALDALAHLAAATAAMRGAVSYDPTGPVPDNLTVPGEVRPDQESSR